MPMLSRLASAWRNLAHFSRTDRHLSEELEAYVALLAEEKMREGLSSADARREALVEVRGIEQVKEEVRDARAGAALDALARDVRYGARSLMRAPGFTAAAVIALALGIGANTAMLSVVDAVLLKPLPYANADRLVIVMHHGIGPVSPANFSDWRSRNRVFDAMGAAEYWTPNLTGTDEPEKIHALHVSSDIFPMLGVAPALGRFFTAEEDVPGHEKEIVIGYGLWQRRFAGDPHVVGRKITLDGESYTVIAVMPRGFQFAPFWATEAEAWGPLALGPLVTNRERQSLRIFARLKEHVTLAQAQSDIAGVTSRLEQEFPGTNRDVRVVELKERVVGDVRTPLLVLLGAVVFVLLIACANVAHMLLARAASRQREVAVRTALGAGRMRIVRQFLTESVLLAMLGGAGGIALAALAVRAIVALSPASIPRIASVTLDGRVLGITLVISMVTGIAFGLAPALQASVVNLSASFKEGGRGASEGVQRGRFRSLLMISEFALALVLLVGAGLMMRSFIAQQSIDSGFDPRNVLTMVVSVTGSKEAEPARRALFFTRVVERVRHLRGVQSAGAINHLPIAGDSWRLSFAIEGRPVPAVGEAPTAIYRVVLADYFRAMAIPIVRGRGIRDGDDLHALPVVVINERLARRRWPGEDPIGKRIAFDRSGEQPTWLTVVGVVKNARQDAWVGTPDDEVYLSYLQNKDYLESTHDSYLTLVMRAACAPGIARCDAASLVPAARRAIAELDNSVTLADVQTMEHVVDTAQAGPWFYVILLGAFAIVALALAAVGIYGVMSYSVSRRTHEIGIRVALGAGRGEVIRLVVRQAMVVAAIGAGVGLIGSLALTRLMSGLLYGVGPADPLTFAAVSLVLGGVALAASYVPARRATRIDPLVALKHE